MMRAGRAASPDPALAGTRAYMLSIITWPKPEHDTWVAPSSRRAKS
jgi:hypothetical protein